MHKLSITLAMVLLTVGLAGAAEQSDVLAPVHQFVDGFNKGDTPAALAACASETAIIDEFAPFAWGGAGACSAWANAYEADAKKNGITEGFVTLGKPRHVDIAGDRAYVVVPANYSYKQNGKPMKEIGSTFTLTLHKDTAGWRITAWSWSKQ